MGTEYDRCCFLGCSEQVYPGFQGQCTWCRGSYDKPKDHKPVFCPDHVQHKKHVDAMRPRSAYVADE